MNNELLLSVEIAGNLAKLNHLERVHPKTPEIDGMMVHYRNLIAADTKTLFRLQDEARLLNSAIDRQRIYEDAMNH